jgi:hypothetical protein
MFVFGGCIQNNSITGDMLSLDVQYYEWSRVMLKGTIKVDPFMQAQCCSVIVPQKSPSSLEKKELKRQSDQVLEGIYFFGGRNAKGELLNKLYWLKVKLIEQRISHVEWGKYPKV